MSLGFDYMFDINKCFKSDEFYSANCDELFDDNSIEWLLSQLDSEPDIVPNDDTFIHYPGSPDSISSEIDDNSISTLPALSWCIKSGKKKSQPFWSYCETNHSNYIKFAFSNPHFTITNNSRIAYDLDGNYIVIENFHSRSSKAFYLHDFNQIITVDTQTCLEVAENDIDFKLQVICDNEEPVHPHQGISSLVKFEVECIDDPKVKNVLPKPFGMFFKLNLIGRVEGFFKVECSLYHKNQIILSTHSDTFMMNDPRVKKKPQHKLFSCKELKFMRLCSLDKQKNTFHNPNDWIDLANSLQLNNPTNLINQSHVLFPKSFRRKVGKRPRPEKFDENELVNPTKRQKL